MTKASPSRSVSGRASLAKASATYAWFQAAADMSTDAERWGEILRDCPTALLQTALAARTAVTAKFVGLEEHETLTIAGPAWVTVNRD